MTSTLCDTCDKDSRYAAAMDENAKLSAGVSNTHWGGGRSKFSALPFHAR